MIIAAVKLSDIELDVDAERPERAKPKCYARTTWQVKISRVLATLNIHFLAGSGGQATWTRVGDDDDATLVVRSGSRRKVRVQTLLVFVLLDYYYVGVAGER